MANVKWVVAATAPEQLTAESWRDLLVDADVPARLQAGSVLRVRGEPRTVLDVVYPRGYPCVRFEGCRDAVAAELLRGAMIEIDEADLPELPEGEYYLHDLVGLAVVSLAGDELGRRVEVLEGGAQGGGRTETRSAEVGSQLSNRSEP